MVSDVAAPAWARACARSSGDSGDRRSSRQRERMVGRRPDGWWEMRRRVAPAGGSSSSFSRALAAATFSSSAASTITTRRPPSAAERCRKPFSLRTSSTRMSAESRSPLSFGPRRRTKRPGSAPACIWRATGWSGEMSSVSGGGGGSPNSPPPSAGGVASRKRAMRQASVALPTPRGPVSSQPWCRRPVA